MAGKETFDKHNSQVNLTFEIVVAMSYPLVLGWVFIDGRFREVVCRGM